MSPARTAKSRVGSTRDARDVARALAGTAAFEQSQFRDLKWAEMLFAHWRVV